MSLSNPDKEWEIKIPTRYDNLTSYQKANVRREYSRLQGHFCWFCGSSLYGSVNEDIQDLPIDWDLFPGGEGFLKYPIHLQHNHDTGMTEGAVHAYCNAFMWNYYRR